MQTGPCLHKNATHSDVSHQIWVCNCSPPYVPCSRLNPNYPVTCCWQNKSNARQLWHTLILAVSCLPNRPIIFLHSSPLSCVYFHHRHSRNSWCMPAGTGHFSAVPTRRIRAGIAGKTGRHWWIACVWFVRRTEKRWQWPANMSDYGLLAWDW